MKTEQTKEPTSTVVVQTPQPGLHTLVPVVLNSLWIIGFIVAVSLYRTKLQPKLEEVKRSLALPLKTEQRIYAVLGQILNEANADRVVLYQLHNGQEYYSGYSYSKVTATHESLREGISSIVDRVKETPTSLFAEELTVLKESWKQNHKLLVTPGTLENSTSKQRLLRDGTEAYYGYQLVDANKEIGILQIQYCHLNKITQLEDNIGELVGVVNSLIVPEQRDVERVKLFFGIFDALKNRG
jgi:hypothetical protein